MLERCGRGCRSRWVLFQVLACLAESRRHGNVTSWWAHDTVEQCVDPFDLLGGVSGLSGASGLHAKWCYARNRALCTWSSVCGVLLGVLGVVIWTVMY